MEEKWKSTNPRDLAYEIATFMGGEWPTRPVRQVQLSLDGAPTDAETLLEMTVSPPPTRFAHYPPNDQNSLSPNYQNSLD